MTQLKVSPFQNRSLDSLRTARMPLAIFIFGK